MKIKGILLIVAIMATVGVAYAQQKPRVAVYMTGDDPVNEIIANRLMSGFINSGKYMPVERSAAFLAAVLKEQSFEREGTVDDDQIAELGKQFGLQYVCVVSVLDVWQSEKYVTAHIIDVNSAEVIGSCSSNGTLSSGDALMKALDDLSQKLTKALDYSKQSAAIKVAVYVTRTGNRDVDVILGDQLVAGFAKSGRYVAVERTNAFLKQLQKETGYQQSGAVDDNEQIAELGKRFGVQYVCVAKTIWWCGAYYISARLVNVETVEVPKMYNAENKVMNNSSDVVKVTQEIAISLTGVSAILPSLSGDNSNGQDFTETAFGLNMRMVYVEGGTFIMGCTSEQGGDCDDNESPNRRTTVNSFYMGMLEVTQSQWEKVMGTTIYQQRNKVNTDYPIYGTGVDYPMYWVSWEEAKEFCARLSRQTGKTYRLPTEAEWEYAARGGNKNEGTKYSGGWNVDDVAWYGDNSGGSTHVCGTKKANALGICDMSGNVYEWCEDWYGSYLSCDTDNPHGASSGGEDQCRVMRGGSWGHDAWLCRISLRWCGSPDGRGIYVGFRVLLVP